MKDIYKPFKKWPIFFVCDRWQWPALSIYVKCEICEKVNKNHLYWPQMNSEDMWWLPPTILTTIYCSCSWSTECPQNTMYFCTSKVKYKGAPNQKRPQPNCPKNPSISWSQTHHPRPNSRHQSPLGGSVLLQSQISMSFGGIGPLYDLFKVVEKAVQKILASHGAHNLTAQKS